MQKKFSVFISSVYKGMQDVRATVATAVAEATCIPEGMERFEISTRNKWAVIRNAINRSDFCIVILRDRYGSIVPDQFVRATAGLAKPGVGYTELEYLFAKKRDIPILPFLHMSPETGDTIPSETEENREKFEVFRARLSHGSPGYWGTSEDLHGKVKDALHQAMLAHPNREGWVRGYWKKRSEELEKKVQDLEEKQKLREQGQAPWMRAYRSPAPVKDASSALEDAASWLAAGLDKPRK